MPAPTSYETGRRIEELVCSHLQRHGLQLLDRNYRGRRGEIDLVMQHNGTTVFVEIRYRATARYGSGAESVDARKRQRLITTALHYLQARPALMSAPSRFDVVTVRPQDRHYDIDWITDAFRA